ncbi:hypothetical protein [Faecalibacter macacae]|uniref:RiboL-PSP-HEPN domain-containing protein n=1 Tax=Faecalibacter macacae TaxID=1859289 RepID=A0A3L9M1A2_9FLAO|nr:hypothetical protein [Faecalibacter macacae]RLZ06662.1 hypothetical protein EAH69_12695 [Faecalibacter macacae]
MKIIENKPLTEFSKLPIQVQSTKKVDLTKSELPPNEQEELLKKLFQEIGKLKDSGKIILAQSSGSESYVMARIIPSKAKNNPLVFTEPNPVTIYYNCAIAHIETSLELQAKIINNSWSPIDLYNEFISFFSESFQGITQLLMSLEALFNQLIPDDIELNLNGKNLTKKDIEWQKFKEKYRYILPEISGINLFEDYNDDYQNIITLNDIRNDLIHLKSIRKENFTYYQALFKTLIDLDYKRFSNSVHKIITILQ